MKKYLIILIGIIVLITGATVVKANSSFFSISKTTSGTTASTSVTYMTSGAGTTTLVYDAYGSGINSKLNGVTALIQFAGSSTASTLHIEVEYAHDLVGTNCVTTPLACDWYRDNLTGLSRSTTTGAIIIQQPNAYDWKFASSTVGGATITAATGATSTKAINIETPTRYMRLVFSMAGVANGNGAIWAQIVPFKENN